MTTFKPDEWVVEPCNVAIIHCITSINIGNIPGYSCEGKSNTIIESKKELRGEIKLSPGFNCAITERNNTFTIESILGGGACLTEPYCTSNLLDVNNECTLCDETVKAINGVNGIGIKLNAGTGIIISPKEGESNTLVIKLNTQQFKNGCEVEE